MRSRVAVALAALATAWGSSGLAQSARDGMACERTVVPARQREPLSRVLGMLAERHGFTLEYWSADDPLVLHGGGDLAGLIGALSNEASMMVRYVPDPACGSRRIATVWVLQTGVPVEPPRRTAPPAIPAGKTAVSVPDAATSAFLRAHGVGAGPSPASAPSGMQR